jgi:hypothetical protein
MVGPGRLELPTPRLSSVCSNQLSYGPILPSPKRPNINRPYRPEAVAGRPAPSRSVSLSKTGGTTRERKPMVHILLKKEKRSRRSSPYRTHMDRMNDPWSAYFVCDRDLTGPIYVLKSTGRFMPGHILRYVLTVLPVPQLP